MASVFPGWTVEGLEGEGPQDAMESDLGCMMSSSSLMLIPAKMPSSSHCIMSALVWKSRRDSLIIAILDAMIPPRLIVSSLMVWIRVAFSMSWRSPNHWSRKEIRAGPP